MRYAEPPFVQPEPPRPPRKNGHAAAVAGIVGAVLVLLCLGGVAVAAFREPENKAARVATVPDVGVRPTPSPSPLAAPSPTPTAALSAADVKLTVKVTDKQCFGSAGCNVEFEIRAGWPVDAIPSGGECEVTYELRGASDPQIGTLTMRDDGQFSQDSFNFAQTPKRSSKLTARVTEVECR